MLTAPRAAIPFVLENRFGDSLQGDIHLPHPVEKPPVLVICHGFKGFKDWGFFPAAAEKFASCGFVTVRFNFSLNGIGEDPLEFTRLDSFRRNTLSRELSDLGDLLDAVAAGGLLPPSADRSRIALLGHSRGGGIALLQAAADARVRAVATWAAVSTFDRWGPHAKAEWRERGFLQIVNQRTGQVMRLGIEALEDYESDPSRFDVEGAAARLRIPLLIVHGEKDVSVPVEEAGRLYSAADKSETELCLIPETGHTFGVTHPFEGITSEFGQALDKTADWLVGVFKRS